MRRIRISQPKPGVIVARGFRREPLGAVIRSPLLGPDGSPVCRPGQFVSTDDVLLGWDEDGTPVVLNLAYSAHALVAGLTRSGKSITVNTLLAYASLMRDVRLIVIDPNLGAVAPWWRTAYKVSDAIHPGEPTEILRWVRAEMQRRERLFWSGRTDRITDFSPELPLLLVVIDEVANYTRHPDRKARERFEAELLAIASQGAKFGIRLWLLTQKPSADVLTTAVPEPTCPLASATASTPSRTSCTSFPTAGNWTSPPPTAPCPRASPSPPSATCAPPSACAPSTCPPKPAGRSTI
jgi:S-DNA-T family DNA segregation ATPase FtsK/SpoIIIE